MFWAFDNGVFNFFAHFSVNNLKMFLGKAMQSIQNCKKSKLDLESILENGFEATLRAKADVQNLWVMKLKLLTVSSKANVLHVWKGNFSVFWKFLIDEVETVFWETEAKRSKLFKSKFGHRELVKKWFWSYLELKNEWFEHLKMALFSFLRIFEWRS